MLERKFHRPEAGLTLAQGHVVSGYASLFGLADQGGDVVQKGAYSASLERLRQKSMRVKMLWQHDPSEPIGVWEEAFEDELGLWVKGRILTEVERGREVAALLEAGAIDGLSIGYRTLRATREGKGRALHELELWEVSLVTFPMLAEARIAVKSDAADEIAQMFEAARAQLARR